MPLLVYTNRISLQVIIKYIRKSNGIKFVFNNISLSLLMLFYFSQGSVIVSFTITFPGAKTIQDIINAIEDGKLGNLSISVIKIINNMGKFKK